MNKEDSKSSFLEFLENFDDDISDWPEWKKRPEASIMKLRPSDLLPPEKKKKEK